MLSVSRHIELSPTTIFQKMERRDRMEKPYSLMTQTMIEEEEEEIYILRNKIINAEIERNTQWNSHKDADHMNKKRNKRNWKM